jgi:hypothetical protein
VAAEPGLPLRLLGSSGRLPPFSRPRRQLLGLRLELAGGGHASGAGPGGEISGVDVHGRLPRCCRGNGCCPNPCSITATPINQLLYRARQGREPPRLRPVVLVLDVSAPSFGPIEAITRPAAHILASSLLAAGLTTVLVLVGHEEHVRIAERPADLVELWTARSLRLASAARGLARASAMRQLLTGGLLEPVIVLLAQPWFGSEEQTPPIDHLRALFVQYPGHHTSPDSRRPLPPLGNRLCQLFHQPSRSSRPPADINTCGHSRKTVPSTIGYVRSASVILKTFAWPDRSGQNHASEAMFS